MTSEGRLSDRFGDLHLDEEVTRTGFQNGNFNPLLGFHGHAENWVNEIEVRFPHPSFQAWLIL